MHLTGRASAVQTPLPNAPHLSMEGHKPSRQPKNGQNLLTKLVNEPAVQTSCLELHIRPLCG